MIFDNPRPKTLLVDCLRHLGKRWAQHRGCGAVTHGNFNLPRQTQIRTRAVAVANILTFEHLELG